jgi:hypothetical protein
VGEKYKIQLYFDISVLTNRKNQFHKLKFKKHTTKIKQTLIAKQKKKRHKIWEKNWKTRVKRKLI